MSTETCYVCRQPLPAGQSYYEDHGVKVCLSCFRTVPRCQKCRFPSKSLTQVDNYGAVCEFCEDSFSSDEGMACHICKKKIWERSSYYEDHGAYVCQSRFKDARIRCFSCRFPQIVTTVPGVGGICKFCNRDNLNAQTDLNPVFQSMIPFLKQYNHKLISPLDIQRMDWRVILGMQVGSAEVSVKFFNELVHYCYPVYYLKDRFYILPSIQQQWFIPYLAGQLVTADLCKKYKLPHLQGESPFHQLARGWSHWVAYTTAKILKNKTVAKSLSRYPQSVDLIGLFPKFLAMSEHRSTAEVISFAQKNLKEYGKKYLR